MVIFKVKKMVTMFFQTLKWHSGIFYTDCLMQLRL